MLRCATVLSMRRWAGPVVGGVVPPTDQLKTLTEGERASGARVEPTAWHVHAQATLPVFGEMRACVPTPMS